MGWVTPLVVTLVAVVVVSSSASPSTPPLSVTSVNVASGAESSADGSTRAPTAAPSTSTRSMFRLPPRTTTGSAGPVMVASTIHTVASSA
jgi:hypothetical protein